MGHKFFQRTPKSLPWRQIDRVLLAAGATFVSQKGSHRKYIRAVGAVNYVIILQAHDNDEVPEGTLNNIIRMAHLTKRRFWSLYYGQEVRAPVAEPSADAAE